MADPEEEGQAECRKCGEWYRVTAPYAGHVCRNDALENRRVARLTPAESMRGGKRVSRAPMLDEEPGTDG